VKFSCIDLKELGGADITVVFQSPVIWCGIAEKEGSLLDLSRKLGSGRLWGRQFAQ